MLKKSHYLLVVTTYISSHTWKVTHSSWRRRITFIPWLETKNTFCPWMKKQHFVVFVNIFVFPGQHWGRVCAYGRGWGHLQGVPHPTQEPEDPGCRRGDHPPEPRNQARDLVRSDHQLLDQRSRLQGGKGKGGFEFNLRFYVFRVWGLGPGLGRREPSFGVPLSSAWGGSVMEGCWWSIKVRVGN